MLKKMFKLNNVKALTKNQQKQINGGFGGDECSTVCYQHGDCCIYILNLPPPFGSIEQPGQCLGLRCVPY
jgi:hypothetical protein